MRIRRPTRPLTATTVDVLVVAVVAFPTLMDAWWNEEGTRQADGITYSLALVSVLSLLVRRRRPLTVSVVCGAALTALFLIDHHGELLNLPTMVALYTTASQGDRRRTLIVGAVAASWSGGVALAVGSPVGSPVLEMLWPVVALALGEVVRLRRELLAEYQARAARAEAEREREAEHRVQTERVRIAREFHDVVAHTMAAVNVQMGVAAAAFDKRPETARDALVQARASSRQALQELRSTIALLRDSTSPGEPLPAPRLDEIGELVETARAVGLAVTVHRGPAGGTDEGPDDDLDRLPAAVQLAAYRIIQEALTNVIRHADAGHVDVSLGPDGTDLVVEVTDDGDRAGGDPPAPGDEPPGGAGHGLMGMAERAAALGGRVEHGPLPRGGFRVRAVLPRGRVEP